MTSPNYYWYYVNTRYKNTFLYSIVQKLKFVKFKWEGGKRDVNYNNYQKTKETRWKIATNCTRLQGAKQWIIKSDIWFNAWKQAIKKSTNQRLALSMNIYQKLFLINS